MRVTVSVMERARLELGMVMCLCIGSILTLTAPQASDSALQLNHTRHRVRQAGSQPTASKRTSCKHALDGEGQSIAAPP